MQSGEFSQLSINYFNSYDFLLKFQNSKLKIHIVCKTLMWTYELHKAVFYCLGEESVSFGDWLLFFISLTFFVHFEEQRGDMQVDTEISHLLDHSLSFPNS